MSGQSREFGVPLVIGDCTGFIHDGGGSTAVLMMPAWGFEEFTIRRGWAELAVMLAGAGYCCLRFDWPGVGDSLGDTGRDMSLDRWTNAAAGAADYLRGLHGIKKLVVLGHGMGGLLAPHLAERLSAEAVVMMAPQNEGKAGLRELDLMGKMMSSFLGISPVSDETVIEVAGFRIARTFAAEIAALRIDDGTQRPALPVLAMSREGTRAATEWPERLVAAGFDVTRADYEGYESFFAHNRSSVTPIAAFRHLQAWLTALVPSGSIPGRAPELARAGARSAVRQLKGHGFLEEPVVFGPEERLFGVVCRPQAVPSRAIVVLLNSGDNYHVGWSRMHVEFARNLAGRGVSTLRIDIRGIGDSARTDAPIFYNQKPIMDVVDAVACAERLNLGPVVLSGSCSGGYAALQAAIRDARVRGLVAVNTPRLAIGVDETVEEVLAQGTSSISVYRRRALSLDLVKDVMSGRLALGAVAAKARRVLCTQMRACLQRLLGTGLYRIVREQTKALRSRGVRTVLVYAENDGGLDELARYFGRRRPQDCDNAEVRIVPDAEHTMSAAHARKAILNAISDVADAVST
ncbi:alpha/beta hydrolase [Rhizobium sp. PAMB 3182]